jgi:hypothetical protein
MPVLPEVGSRTMVSGLDSSRCLCVVDHCHGDTILDAVRRITELQLGGDGAFDTGC